MVEAGSGNDGWKETGCGRDVGSGGAKEMVRSVRVVMMGVGWG